MIRIFKYTLCLLISLSGINANAQKKFFNLKADEVRIDSLLPYFTYSIPVGENYADTVYSVSIEYPEFIDMTQNDIRRYKAITNETLPELPEVRQNMVVERKKGIIEISFVPLVYREGRHQILVSFMLNIKAEPAKQGMRKTNAAGNSSTSSRYAEHSVLSQGKWAKIRVPSTGVFQITDALIRQAGFSDMNKVKIYGYGGNLINEKLVSYELLEQDDLKEIATCTVNGRRLFYGKGPVSWDSKATTVRTRNPYSDYGYYFLTESDEEPLRLTEEEFVKSFYPSYDDYHELHEIDNFAWYHGGRNLFEDNPINLGSSKTYTVDTKYFSDKGKISVSVSAGVDSNVEISINDNAKSQVRINVGSYDKGNSATLSFDQENFNTETVIKITTLSGGPIRLDNIAISSLTPKPQPDIANGIFPAAEYVHNITNQDLHADGPIDMLIIIPTSQKLRNQAERIKEFHEQYDKMRVRILPADELYNEFSSGTPDASAYRKYLKMQYDRAQTDEDMPKYLLLFGDCAWDNRMLTSDWRTTSVDDYLLCFESENSFNEIHCYIDDGFYCYLDDGEGLDSKEKDKLDMAVGRFPVVTEDDAKTLVDKTINYAMNKNAGSWQNVLMFMGDDGNGKLHMKDVNDAAEDIAKRHPGFIIKKVMWDAYNRETSSTGHTYPEATKAIKQQQAAGALIMDYAGHGRADQISHENVLKLKDFQDFTNTNMPLWITASCDIMPFDGSVATIGEAALLNKKGGAMAFYGTTRTVYANYNKVLNMSFLRHVLSIKDGKPTTLGLAQMRAKNDMITTRMDLTDNKLQYSLLGDPALALKLPTMNIVIDSINGLPASKETSATLKAGSIARISGHIENNGLKETSFNGTVTATIRDKKELIICKNNENAKETPFAYYDRTKILFNGSNSVKEGDFYFEFAVPKDINYDDGTGLINAYAVNDEHTWTANGFNENFFVGGTEPNHNDSIGPSIFCYLNSPSFVNGGDVNTTPYFVAQITDKDGINTTGNGIGHDIELVIDGDMQRTYVLNENFTFDFGSYTKGSTYYNIPELPAGKHTLRFRAWDIQNNSSTAELQFNVVRGLEPNITDISCTNNPATTSTTFIVSHDRVGCTMDVDLEVFDMSGRLLWKHSESGVTTDNAYTIDWDLTVDEGRKLQTGVYLYRVLVSTDGSSKASKAKKLVIICNN